jgi:hypothetical protein
MTLKCKFVEASRKSLAWRLEVDGKLQVFKVGTQTVFDYGKNNFKNGTMIEVTYEDGRTNENVPIKIVTAAVVAGAKTAAPESEAPAQGTTIEAPKTAPTVAARAQYSNSNEGMRRGMCLNNAVNFVGQFAPTFDLANLDEAKVKIAELYLYFYELSAEEPELLKKRLGV